ncbi:MAG TPA: AAA family ATPase, partial [Terriglobales bacterium]|nr:AAA family ATPase [Terriglobales bacterium]
YPSATHREAMASLQYGVQSERAFMAMVAQPGMGKTMLLFNLLQQLGGGFRTAFLFQTQCDSREFLGFLLTDLGLKVQGYDPIQLHEQLKAELLREARAGRRVVVIVDEAQNLDTSVLETVRLLSDFESPSRKLMQIILAGQPQLSKKIASPELVQLRQRLSMIIQIKPLAGKDVATYMARRLQVAGYTGPALFSPEAVGLIAARSHGIPRIINNYCFNALSLAFASQKPTVEADIVLEVARDLEILDCSADSTEVAESNEITPIELPVFAPEVKIAAPISASADWRAREAGVTVPGAVVPESLGIKDLRSPALPSYNVHAGKSLVRSTPRTVPHREAPRPPSLEVVRRRLWTGRVRLRAASGVVGKQLRGIGAFLIRLAGIEITKESMSVAIAKSESSAPGQASLHGIAERATASYRAEGANV